MSEYMDKIIAEAPILVTEQKVIEDAWKMALHTLLEISTVDCPSETYNKTDLWEAEPGLMVRAGGSYPTPWTRDAAVNTMNAACFIEPEVAKNTLWAVCERVDGKLCFQMDKQSWDKIVWATGAWQYYLATGDKEFLKNAYETVKNSLLMLEEMQYNAEFGLFTGGSFFNDGITGYPAKLHQKGNGASFVRRHPDTAFIMTLSTNCLYCNAYRILADMVRVLGGDETEKQGYIAKAEAMKSAINRWLWKEEKGTYSYFIYPDGSTDDSQEGCGISFAVLFGVCDQEKAEKIFSNAQISQRGIVSIWPPFEGISSVEKPIRHNNLIWPFVNAFFADAAAKCGHSELLGEELFNMAKLAVESNGFYEIYNPENGEPDGGWQIGIHWASVPDQTWSATGFIRMLVYGVFGVLIQEDGVHFAPCMPKGLGTISLNNLCIRGIKMNLTLREKDEQGVRIVINGVTNDMIPYENAGEYCVEMWV